MTATGALPTRPPSPASSRSPGAARRSRWPTWMVTGIWISTSPTTKPSRCSTRCRLRSGPSISWSRKSTAAMRSCRRSGTTTRWCSGRRSRRWRWSSGPTPIGSTSTTVGVTSLASPWPTTPDFSTKTGISWTASRTTSASRPSLSTSTATARPICMWPTISRIPTSCGSTMAPGISGWSPARRSGRPATPEWRSMPPTWTGTGMSTSSRSTCWPTTATG